MAEASDTSRDMDVTDPHEADERVPVHRLLRTWVVPVFTYATTTVEFTTTLDPVADPKGFYDAFWEVDHDFPNANVSNAFEMDGEWAISCNLDGKPDVWEKDTRD